MSKRKRDEETNGIHTHHAYTVGWICALPKEQTAATVMLDEIRDSLPKPPHDQNSYTLGSIGKHKVVVACLPKGQYGTTPAAKAVTWMTTTFPSIRIGLMVGIAGGVPFKVKLGDVVVSTPTDEYPGVVQWDMGKAEDGGQFKRTGFLNNPPTALLTAMTRLETHHTIHGSKITQCLAEVERRYPNLDNKFTRSGFPLDLQTQSEGFGPVYDALTVETVPVTSESAVSDTSRDVRKAPKTQVHYGLIASGNQVIKDSLVRDRLDKSLDGKMLCVEMEAAGLMNDFPCVVIRGICDYADSQRNKDWQEYAATIAAAYAKELLEIIDPVDVEHAPEARSAVDLRKYFPRFGFNRVQNIFSSNDAICKIQKQQISEDKRSKLFQWLSPLRPSARHSENVRQRVEDTGMCLLEHPEFVEWSSTEAEMSVLYCYGDPGAGKTILSSLVINELEQRIPNAPSLGLAYLYCDYRDGNLQTTENIFGAILQQLLESLSKIPPNVWTVYEDQVTRHLPLSLDTAENLLGIVCTHFSKIRVCLDAIDEITDLQKLMKVLQRRTSNIQLFITGRPHVQDTLQNYLSDANSISIEARPEDIERFIVREIEGPNDAEPDAMDDELYANVMTTVIKSAKGIFLLPVLQIRTVLQNLTIRERAESLKTLPSDLGDAFIGTFTWIQQQPDALSKRAAHIIAWIHLAMQPLTIEEVLCSLSVREGDKNFEVQGVPVELTLLKCCCGLVVTDEQTRTIRLVHYSLDEHLGRQNQIFGTTKDEWHGRTAAICLNFLSFPVPATYETQNTTSVQYALLEYGATQWGHHLRLSRSRSADNVGLAMEYLSTGWRRNMPSLRLLYEVMYQYIYPLKTPDPTLDVLPGHIAAFFGCLDLFRQENLANWRLSSRDTNGTTPLALAAEGGHNDVAKLLIARSDVDVNSKDDRRGYKPLHAAALMGHSDVVELLLARPDVDVNMTSIGGNTPLMLAVVKVQIHVVKLLLARADVNVNKTNQNGLPPLLWAVLWGHSDVVELLLARADMNVNMTDDAGYTPLMVAVMKVRSIVVKLLLARTDVDMDIEDENGRTALHRARARGDIRIAKMLHDYQAGLSIQS